MEHPTAHILRDVHMCENGVLLAPSLRPWRQVAHKHIQGEYLDMPFTADGWGPSGIYFMPRKANSQLVFGSLDHRSGDTTPSRMAGVTLYSQVHYTGTSLT